MSLRVLHVGTVRVPAPALPFGAPPPLPHPVHPTPSFQRRPDGLTIPLPPVGLRKGSKGLFSFAIIWNGVILLFTVLAVLGMVGVLEGDDGPTPAWGLL